MSKEKKVSFRFEKQTGTTITPYLILGDFEFRMTHQIELKGDDIIKFLRDVGAFEVGTN